MNEGVNEEEQTLVVAIEGVESDESSDKDQEMDISETPESREKDGWEYVAYTRGGKHLLRKKTFVMGAQI